jgi:hypothetical protein
MFVAKVWEQFGGGGNVRRHELRIVETRFAHPPSQFHVIEAVALKTHQM